MEITVREVKETFQKGSIVLITEGEYSDYGITAVCRWITDRNYQELVDEYLENNPKQAVDYQASFSSFLAFLIGEKAVEEIDYSTFHLGNYSTLKPEAYIGKQNA